MPTGHVDTKEKKNIATKENSDTIPTRKREGLKIDRHFVIDGKHPFDAIEWTYRTAVITNDKGEEIFKQDEVEVPNFWTALATNVVVSKYFAGAVDTPNRETSVKQLIERICRTIADWGLKDGYFKTEEDADNFYHELTYLTVNQVAAFNSPVWFNLGLEPKPQCSACFINSVEDTMESILDLAKTEGMLFKYGSGTGTNLSTLRSSKERLSTGGWASGPVSFMRGYDAFAGVIKSGGKTRRAAKMVILDIDHPDILEFIDCKVIEEKKAWALIDAGYDGSLVGDAYGSVFFQNSNNSVRVSDAFMKAVEEDREWYTVARLDGAVIDTYKARELLMRMAESAHICGDPGIQYDTTINVWHTCKNSGSIRASNPCSEYMFLNDSACNLASLNLMKFRTRENGFDVESFRHAVNILIIAQDILVENASYPNEKITINSHKYRPLGLGYANLGALLMSYGLPYDSDRGRDLAATITALMTGQAYLTSAELAGNLGTFDEFERNRQSMLDVIVRHQGALLSIESGNVDHTLYDGAELVWTEALHLGQENGYRNAQVSVLAPTGTIGFMMDCDTTGIEPDIALVKSKSLADGGELVIVNNTVPLALKTLDYDVETRNRIIRYIEEHGMIEGCPDLRNRHLPVFDCAFKPAEGERSIDFMGHVKMMAAVQPFISGAISKTVNMPKESTAEDIYNVYIEGWRLGLKSIAIYRDGSKKTQPLKSGKDKERKETKLKPIRRRLPDERQAITHKFSIEQHEGYITVGLYDDGKPGEIFIVMSKEGSTISGVMDAFATAVSLALQYGVPLEVLTRKFSHSRFEPMGWTKHPKVKYATSIMDYMFRWLAWKFLPHDKNATENGTKAVGATTPLKPEVIAEPGKDKKIGRRKLFQNQEDAPLCSNCGMIMVRSGSCHKCLHCGMTNGCS